MTLFFFVAWQTFIFIYSCLIFFILLYSLYLLVCLFFISIAGGGAFYLLTQVAKAGSRGRI
jgi:hypothetical protein